MEQQFQIMVVRVVMLLLEITRMGARENYMVAAAVGELEETERVLMDMVVIFALNGVCQRLLFLALQI